MAKLPVAPIQNEKGILHFSQEGRSYTLNVNSKEERERVKNEINANSLTEYEWFKEKRGKKHWVLYNTEMYEIIGVSNKYLHYKELCSIVPTIPINATSCRYMFHDCSKLTQLNLSIQLLSLKYLLKKQNGLEENDLFIVSLHQLKVRKNIT